MILLFRKYLVRIFLGVTFLTVVFGIVFFFRGMQSSEILVQSFSTGQIWWLKYDSADKYNLRFSWLILMACSSYSLIVGISVFRQIKKNPSPQLAFLYLFIFTFSLHILRLTYLLPPAPGVNLDIEFITRIVYFSRFFGLTAFFSASLFTTGLQIQKFSYVLLITILVSFTLSIILPINTIGLTSGLLFRIAEEKSVALFCLSLEILTILNYFSAAVKQSRAEFYRLILFSIMILAGFELLFFLYTPFLLPGFILLLSGTIFYIRTSQKLFLWA